MKPPPRHSLLLTLGLATGLLTTVNGLSEPKPYLMGSIYGGLLFTFKEDKVSEMFLGAMTE